MNADWRFIGSVCRDAERDLGDLVPHIVRCIRTELPEYAVVPLAEHEQMVSQQLAGLLRGLANQRLPGPAESGHGRLLGLRRAEQGISVDALLGAYHVGYRELWNILLERARSQSPERAGRLLGLVNLIWAWLHTLTSAAADGYAEVVRAREESRSSLGHQFLEALYGGQAAAESTGLLARALGLDPGAEFQAVCCERAVRSAEDLDGLQHRLRTTSGSCLAITRGSTLVILFQRVPAGQIVELLPGGTRQLTAGVGLPRPGLPGAAASIADAEQALAVSQRRGHVVWFGADWLVATLQPHWERLRPLVGAEPAVLQPHLCEAVRAFATHRFSVTASAHSLGVHPNTVKYRLDRWQRLTGWDPRTLDGLVRSMLCIAFQPSA
jgi:hypothetical protein